MPQAKENKPEETDTDNAPEEFGGKQLVLPFMKDYLPREPVDKKSGQSKESNGRTY